MKRLWLLTILAAIVAILLSIPSKKIEPPIEPPVVIQEVPKPVVKEFKPVVKPKLGNPPLDVEGQAIAALGSIPKTRVQNQYFDGWIEVTKMTATEKGVEVLARAWTEVPRKVFDDEHKGNRKSKDIPIGQIGFGERGDIDLERFVFVNINLLVPDPNGSIVKSWTDINGQLQVRKFREDAKDSILRRLSMTFNSKKQLHSSEKIVRGKVGNTTTVVNPDTAAGNAGWDAELLHDYGAGNDELWATLIAAAGSATNDDDAARTFIMTAGANVNEWRRLWRMGFIMDTSGIPNGETISSATFTVYGSGTASSDTCVTTPNLNVVGLSSVASTANPSNGDYANRGTTAFATAISYASWDANDGGDNVFTLNAAGLAGITDTAYDEFAIVNDTYDRGETAPVWVSGCQATHSMYMAGTANEPVLTIESSSASTDDEVSNNFIISL